MQAVRSEKKQVIVAGQRPSDRSAVVLFLRLGQKSESELDSSLGRRRSPGGIGAHRHVYQCLIPQPLARAGETVCRFCLFVLTCLTRILFWLSVKSQRQSRRRGLKYICLSMMQSILLLSILRSTVYSALVLLVTAKHVPKKYRMSTW